MSTLDFIWYLAHAVGMQLSAERGRARVRTFGRDDARAALRAHLDHVAEHAAVNGPTEIVTRCRGIVPNSYGYKASSDVIEFVSRPDCMLEVHAGRGRARSAPHGKGSEIVTGYTTSFRCPLRPDYMRFALESHAEAVGRNSPLTPCTRRA